MKTLIYHIPCHSIVDLITNSSSELFIFKGEPRDETAKILLNAITNKSIGESRVMKLDDYVYKDEFILPSGIDPKDVYVAEIDYQDSFLETILDEIFERVVVEWK